MEINTQKLHLESENNSVLPIIKKKMKNLSAVGLLVEEIKGVIVSSKIHVYT